MVIENTRKYGILSSQQAVLWEAYYIQNQVYDFSKRHNKITAGWT